MAADVVESAERRDKWADCGTRSGRLWHGRGWRRRDAIRRMVFRRDHGSARAVGVRAVVVDHTGCSASPLDDQIAGRIHAAECTGSGVLARLQPSRFGTCHGLGEWSVFCQGHRRTHYRTWRRAVSRPRPRRGCCTVLSQGSKAQCWSWTLGRRSVRAGPGGYGDCHLAIPAVLDMVAAVGSTGFLCVVDCVWKCADFHPNLVAVLLLQRPLWSGTLARLRGLSCTAD